MYINSNSKRAGLDEAMMSRRNFLKVTAAAIPAITGGFGSKSIAHGQSGRLDTHADPIVTNGKIATLAQKGTFSQAFAVRDGRFSAVGNNKVNTSPPLLLS